MDSSQRWTVAVYLAGGENVSREMIPALHDMRDAALTNRPALQVLAQFEPDQKPPRLFAFEDTLPLHFTVPARHRGPAPTATGLPNYEYVLETGAAEGAKLSSVQRLREFVETARSAASDGRLMVVISGHANGAVGEFLGFRNSGEPIYLRDLKNALEPKTASQKKIDIIGMDCCHMSMVEVGFEIAPYARFLVGSEGYILNHGWPYRAILDALAGLEAEEAGAEIVHQYVGSYSDYSLLDVPSHCAVSDLERMQLLREPMRRLSELLTSRIEDPDVWRPAVLAHWEAQSYKDEEYVDLADFCDRLRAHIGDPEIQFACSDVIVAVAGAVVASAVSGSAFQFSTGLSIYFPWCNDAVKAKTGTQGAPSELERYQELTFSRETGWGRFLDAYLSVTRRGPRPDSPASLKRGESFQPSSPPVPASSAASLPVRGSHECQPASQFRPAKSSKKEEKEVPMVMAIKRVPPWHSKGGPERTSVKNHPRTEGSEERPLPIRRVPPWHSKGTTPSPSHLKNHPQKRED